MSRYKNTRFIIERRDGPYGEFLQSRNVKILTHYATPVLQHPTEEERAQLQRKTHIWKVGDTFSKLAYQYYDGALDLWYILAWYNERPTDAHVNVGDLIYVPFPLDMVLRIFGV